MVTRREFLKGLSAALIIPAAPAIVRAESLMPVKSLIVPEMTPAQLWRINETGSHWFTPNLSRFLREEVHKHSRFRQICDLPYETQNNERR